MDAESCFHLLGAGGTFDRKRQNPFGRTANSAVRKKEKVDFFAPEQRQGNVEEEEEEDLVQFVEIPPLVEEEEIGQWRKAYR